MIEGRLRIETCRLLNSPASVKIPPAQNFLYACPHSTGCSATFRFRILRAYLSNDLASGIPVDFWRVHSGDGGGDRRIYGGLRIWRNHSRATLRDQAATARFLCSLGTVYRHQRGLVPPFHCRRATSLRRAGRSRGDGHAIRHADSPYSGRVDHGSAHFPDGRNVAGRRAGRRRTRRCRTSVDWCLIRRQYAWRGHGRRRRHVLLLRKFW